MSNKEATASIKINKLLEAAGWRFFAEGNAPANIGLESITTIKSSDLDALGENFEKTSKGFIDFLLLNAKGFPLIVLEAKSEKPGLAQSDSIYSYGVQRAAVHDRRRDAFDRLIAAHATSLGLTLITNNEADFRDYPGLIVENWGQ